MLNAAGGNLSIRYGLRGINYSVATACASANNAIGDALKAIQHGDCRRDDHRRHRGGDHADGPGRLSEHEGPLDAERRSGRGPAGRSTPTATASCSAKGRACWSSKSYEHAKARGAKIYCEVLGFGASADAGHITQPDEQGTGAARAMSDALARCQAQSRRRSTTSTPTARARRWATRPRRRPSSASSASTPSKVSISSTKSQLGHSLGASGGIELVVTRQGAARRRHSADDQSRQLPTRRAISTTRPTAPASADPHRHEQQLRLRRPQRLDRRGEAGQRPGLALHF